MPGEGVVVDVVVLVGVVLVDVDVVLVVLAGLVVVGEGGTEVEVGVVVVGGVGPAGHTSTSRGRPPPAASHPKSARPPAGTRKFHRAAWNRYRCGPTRTRCAFHHAVIDVRRGRENSTYQRRTGSGLGLRSSNQPTAPPGQRACSR
jgi:hypothetical protein